jgi:hypothetical protein
MVILYTILFASLFAVFLAVFMSNEKLSLAETTVDIIRTKMINYIEKKNGREIKLLELDVMALVKQGLLLGGSIGILLMVFLVGKTGSLSVLAIPAGMLIGIVLTSISVSKKYEKWQGDLVAGLPDLTDFVPAFLEIPGVTIRSALENGLSFLSNPLRAEMEHAVYEISRTGKTKEALDDLSYRADNPTITAICTRLKLAWFTSVKPDIFMDLREELDYARELAIAKSTTARKAYFMLVLLIGIVGMAVLFICPGINWFHNTLNKAFGG